MSSVARPCVVRLAFGALLLTGCASPSPAVSQDVAPAGDAAAFATVVAALRARAPDAEKLRVDPRPIDHGAATVIADELLRALPGELDARRAVIRSLGLRDGDATFPANCAGTLSIDVPGTRGHDGCPQAWRTVAAISRAVPYLPEPRDSLPAGKFWAARVILVTIGPGGINAQSSDYILSRPVGRWTLEKTLVRGYWE